MSTKDFGKVFTCMATSPILDKPLNCTIGPLYPKSLVHIDVIMTQEELQTLSLGCSANTSHYQPSEQDKRPAFNYSWYINDAEVEYGVDGMDLNGDKQYMTLNQTADLPRNTQISCQVFGPHGSLGYATFIVNEEQSKNTYTDITRPTIFIDSQKNSSRKLDIGPIIFINAGAIMLFALLIFIVFCVPKQCRCAKKKQRSPLRRRDSRYADMQFTRTNPCPSPLLMTPPTNLNTYESTDSDTESSKGMSRNGSIPTVVTSMSQSQQQQVQATLHVVVHSPNNINQAQTTTLKACSTEDFGDQNSLYHELSPMPNTAPPPPPTNEKSPSKKKLGTFSDPGKLSPTLKTSPSKSGNSRRHSMLSYDHIPAQQNQYAPTSCATTTAAPTGYYVHSLPLPKHQGKIITSCLRCNHNNTQNNNHLSATYHRNRDSVGVVYENIPLPPHTCNGPPPAPL